MSNDAAGPLFGNIMKQLSVMTTMEAGSNSDLASSELAVSASPVAHEHRDAHSSVESWHAGFRVPLVSSSLNTRSFRAISGALVPSAIYAGGETHANVDSQAVRQAVV